MITVEEAARIFRQYLPALSGDTFADELVSDRDYPPFHRVMMDGIAIDQAAFLAGQRRFLIAGICAAGEPAGLLPSPQHCLEIMTGAPLPKNADLVVPYEHLSIDQGVATITVEQERTLMENVHFEGSDCKKGARVLASGEGLNGPHMGIAASMGYHRLPLKQKPKIMIVSTGDELVEVNETPLPHQIRRSNVFALKRSLELAGHDDIRIDHLRDEAMTVARHYEEHAPKVDLLIYSGGVSKGKFDYLPNVWADLGVTKHFHEVSQRPGKPLWFGSDHARKTIVVGLPGNPVSSLVCLHRYVLQTRPMYARLEETIVFKKPLTYFLPVTVRFERDGTFVARPLAIKNSGEFTALAGSDGFIELPKDQNEFRAGEAFAFYPWRPF